MKESWLGLVCLSPRGYNVLLRSIIHRFVNFPRLRRPDFVIIPLWVTCWERASSQLFVIITRHVSWVVAHNGLHCAILFLNFPTPGILIPINSLLQTFWRRRWGIRGGPCNKSHHWSRFHCDSLLSWILLYFCLPSLQQTVELKLLILNKHNRWFHSSRVEFPFVSMSASWLLLSMYLTWILRFKLSRSNNQSRATLWILETCLIVGLHPLMIILNTASLSSNKYNK